MTMNTTVQMERIYKILYIAMRKNLMMVAVLFFGCVALSSCYPAGYVMVNDYRERMELLKANFPEIYNMYCNGRINITEVYTYPTKEGGERVHVKYEHLR